MASSAVNITTKNGAPVSVQTDGTGAITMQIAGRKTSLSVSDAIRLSMALIDIAEDAKQDDERIRKQYVEQRKGG